MTFSKNPVMVIDGHNLFIRGFVMSPKMNSFGEHIGGVTIFLKSLRKLIEQHAPSHCFVVWDAGNGSPRRRSIYSNYKGGKRPKRLNRNIEDQKKNDYHAEQRKQLIKTVEYLKNLPVKQFFINDCEADDVIGYLCQLIPDEKEIVIVSADRDFYQLIDENIKVFNPIKKTFITEHECKEEFGASPQNVILARSFLGDNSDNIDGVKGIGPKWIKKHLSVLKEDKQIYPSDIKDIIEEKSNSTKLKTWQTAKDNFKDVYMRNYKLMSLNSTMLNHTQQESVKELLCEEGPDAYPLNKLNIIKLLKQDKLLQDFNIEHWFVDFMGLWQMSRSQNLFD